MASAKNQNTNEEKNNASGMPDFSTWVEEATGFAPYWNPDEGKSFFGRILDKDDRDPAFVRYLMQAGEDLQCQRGPAEEAEPVLVKKGEFFTISVYYSIQDLFDLYLECARTVQNFAAWMKVEAVKKSKTTAGNKVWNWKVLVSPQTKQLADGQRSKGLLAAKSSAEQLTS